MPATSRPTRSPAWADEVLRVTGGEGGDVVLNSLVGDDLTRVTMRGPAEKAFEGETDI